MPRPPSYLDQINTVVRFIENPCEAPWAVYFETALEPAGEAILTLLTFGLDDVIRGFARPKGLRSGRHGRRGRRSSGRLPRGVGIPEIGEMIGENLPGAEEAKGRKVSQGVKNLWLVDGAIQRVLFWWMIIDVVSDFAYDWVTAIAETEFCQKQGLGAVLRTSQTGALAAILDWHAARAEVLEYGSGPIQAAEASFLVLTGHWSLAFGATIENTFSLPIEFEIQIGATGGGANPIAISEKVTIQPGERGEAVVSADIKAGDVGFLLYRINQGFADVIDVIQYYQQG